MYADDDYDYITANIDRRIVGENAALECKTMGSFHGYNFENGDIPSHYFCQCQHYMSVIGFDMVYLAILVLQRGLYVVEVKRDDDFIKTLREAETAFWTQYIMQDRMPEPDGSDSSLDTLRQLYPKGYKDLEVTIPGLDRMITDYKSIKEIADDYGKQAERIKAQICQKLGKAEVGIGLKYGRSWKTQSKTSGYDMKRLQKDYPNINIDKYKKVSEYRVFRTRTIKEK
jgi:predicted phage-related endonuclease